MALRDKLRSRSQPFLQPGETVQEVFPVQAGNPWMVGLGGGILMLLLGKPRMSWSQTGPLLCSDKAS